MNTQYEEEDDLIAQLMAETAEENRRKYGGEAPEQAEELDPVERMMAEHAEENSRRYAGGGTEAQPVEAAPTAPAPRVRIPVTPTPSAPKPTPVVLPAAPSPAPAPSFDAQLAELLEEDDEEPTVASALASVRLPSKSVAKAAGEDLPRRGPVGEGKKGQRPSGRARQNKFEVTLDDQRIFLLIAACRYAPANTVALLLGWQSPKVVVRLNRLVRENYLHKRAGLMPQALYSLTAKAHKLMETGLSPEKKDYSRTLVKHNVTAANVLALLITKQLPLPAKTAAKVFHPDCPVGAHYLTDRQLTREVNRYMGERDGKEHALKWRADALYTWKYLHTQQWKKGETSEEGAWGEAAAPWTWLAVGREVVISSMKVMTDFESQKYRTVTQEDVVPWTHTPDLVLTYPRDPVTHRAQAVAIEVEMTDLNREKLRRAILCYRTEFEGGDRSSYSSVLWLCATQKVLSTLRMLIAELPPEISPRFGALLIPKEALVGVRYPEREAALTPEQKARRNAQLTSARFKGPLSRLERQVIAVEKVAGRTPPPPTDTDAIRDLYWAHEGLHEFIREEKAEARRKKKRPDSLKVLISRYELVRFTVQGGE